MFTDYLTYFFNLFFSNENQLIIMFASAFVSASLLPGNSEIVFSTIATQTILVEHSLITSPLIWLVCVATIGNTLGSLLTLYFGRLIPEPKSLNHKYAEWVIHKLNHYGTIMLLLSWLPLLGDLLCGVAGWLRLPLLKSAFYIFMGKFIRYLLLLITIYPLVKYVL
ncbi:YqaA family protein [Haemophilus parahaemolyticus]|uniref:DedA family protein n=1 Tax=Haemophilus parahaemolyticus TaxID=735 RepID=A0A369ZKX1_HAEPH|nr:VTT domain-containing protein [Haemophilus parahaemolyticus]RDF05940.1 DedA family protein [Haemophilus parahaemolyticus]